MSNRVEPSQGDQQQQIDDLLELERRRALQGDLDTQASQDLAARKVTETKQTGEDKTAQAVTQAGDQQARGADWVSFSDTTDSTVPPSVQDIHDDARKVEENNNASQAAKDDANREALQRDMQQRMTIADIQAEAAKKSGIIRG